MDAPIDHGDGCRGALAIPVSAAVLMRMEREFGFPPAEAGQAFVAAISAIDDLALELSLREAQLEETDAELEEYVRPWDRLLDFAAELIHKDHQPPVEPKLCLHPDCDAYHRARRSC